MFWIVLAMLRHLDEVLQLAVPGVVQLLHRDVLHPTPQRLVHLAKGALALRVTASSTAVSTVACSTTRWACVAWKGPAACEVSAVHTVHRDMQPSL